MTTAPRTEKKTLVLNLFEMATVSHISHGLWTLPGNSRRRFDEVGYWTELAQVLEEAVDRWDEPHVRRVGLGEDRGELVLGDGLVDRLGVVPGNDDRVRREAAERLETDELAARDRVGPLGEVNQEGSVGRRRLERRDDRRPERGSAAQQRGQATEQLP